MGCNVQLKGGVRAPRGVGELSKYTLAHTSGSTKGASGSSAKDVSPGNFWAFWHHLQGVPRRKWEDLLQKGRTRATRCLAVSIALGARCSSAGSTFLQQIFPFTFRNALANGAKRPKSLLGELHPEYTCIQLMPPEYMHPVYASTWSTCIQASNCSGGDR